MDPRLIRNFSIVAHIDHGKSTLSDQLLLQTGTITEREFKDQILDDLDVERERGITVKARAVAIHYTHTDGKTYELNFVDTPGHVDFHYEVSRSLAACEGALLLVDAFQGVQAQTVANAYAALEADLHIIPCLNKVDLPVTRTPEVLDEMRTVLGFDEKDVLRTSGKSGIGISDVLSAIVERVPPPKGSPDDPLRSLIFDSKYDNYRGVVVYIRVREGSIRAGTRIRFMKTGTTHEVLEVVSSVPTTRRVKCWGRVRSDTSSRDQTTHACPHRRHRHRSGSAGARTAPRLQAAAADGVLRDVSHRRHRLREAAQRTAENEPQ